MRKGCSYGTIVVDLDRHRVVDLLSDRIAATLAAWLEQRPGIRVVARDRSSSESRAVSSAWIRKGDSEKADAALAGNELQEE